VGLSAMYGMYWLLRLIGSLSSSGNERIANALGRPATVYVAIPAAGKGAGKVQLSMQNRIVEYQAVTDDSEPLKSGQSVEVVEIVGSDIVRVRRAAQPVEV
jgi:membrane-bound ClpP family serine protease